MKLTPAPHSEAYTNEDALVHWKCNETFDSANFGDVSGNTDTLTTTGTPSVSSGAFKVPKDGEGARFFNGTSEYAEGSSSTAAKTALRGNNTWEFWAAPKNANPSSFEYILSHGTGGTDSVEANNVLMSVGINTDGTLRMLWEYGSGTNETFATTDPFFTANSTWVHVGVVIKNASNGVSTDCDVDVYRNGVLFETFTNKTRATGGGNGQWHMAHSPVGGTTDLYTGSLDDVLISAFAKDEAGIRDTYKRAVRSWDLDSLYESGHYETALRVLVEDGDGNMVDLSDAESTLAEGGALRYDFVDSASWRDDVDAPGPTAAVGLSREVYEVSLAPYITSSPLNKNSGGSYDQMLALGRRIYIETATVPVGLVSADGRPPEWAWDRSFTGVIHGIDWAQDPIKVEARGKQGCLQDNYLIQDRLDAINPVGSTLGVDAETVIQNIIDTADPQNVSGSYPTYVGEDGPPQVYVPSPSGWGVRTGYIQHNTTYNECQKFADALGWLFRAKWDNNHHKHRMTYYEPDRAKSTPDFTFADDQYGNLRQFKTDLKWIRNFVRCRYRDVTSTHAGGEWEYAEVTASDASSIAKYGFRAAEINLETTDLISSSTQAQALVDAAVSDLAEPKAAVAIDTAFKDFIEVGDLVRLSDNGITHDTNQDFAVVSWEHVFAADGTANTNLTLRGGAPPGRITGVHAMIQGAVSTPINEEPPDTPPQPVGEYVDGGYLIGWDWPVNTGFRAVDHAEIHVSTSSGFTPSASTFVGTTRGTNYLYQEGDPGTTYYTKIIYKDKNNQVSAASPQRAFTVKRVRGGLPYGKYEDTAASAAIGTSYTQCTFDAKISDELGSFNANQLTIPYDGLYLIRGNVNISAIAGQVAIYVNGALDTEGPIFEYSTARLTFLTVSEFLNLSAGDTVRIYAKLDAPRTQQGGFFTWQLISD